MSGYAPCSCRDCFEISITSDGGWTLCHDCLDAACTPATPEPIGGASGHEFECQREDAYTG